MPYSFAYEVSKSLFTKLVFNVLPLCFHKELSVCAVSSAKHLICFWATSKSSSILLPKNKRFHHVMITGFMKYLLPAFTCLDNIHPNSFVRKQKEQPCFYVHNTFQMIGVYRCRQLREQLWARKANKVKNGRVAIYIWEAVV